MPWNDPLPTFADGGTPTAAQLNQYLDNLNWLHAPPNASYEQTGTADLTTTSTNWGTINSNFATTIVTTGADVLALLSLSIQRLELDISVDGTRFCSSGTAGTGTVRSDNTSQFSTMNLSILYQDIAAGTHTFAAQWKHTGGGTGTIHGIYRPRFDVREL